jgi:CheY-like chemotaxis protein
VAREPDVPKLLLGVRVLLVDADADARELLESVLSYCGAFVTTVPTADDAAAHVARTPTDVVVADVSLPASAGYRLAREIAARVPMIALAHGADDGPDRTLSAGFQAHLRKPVDPWELCRVVASLARKA